MTLTELRDIADTKLAQFWAILTVKQESYLANHGRYWQGILTPANMPEDGTEVYPDYNLKPDYQNEDWHYLELPINTKIPFQIQVHQYICPNGNTGFQATIFVKYNGEIYSRSKGVGQEADSRDYNWKKIIEEDYGE